MRTSTNNADVTEPCCRPRTTLTSTDHADVHRRQDAGSIQRHISRSHSLSCPTRDATPRDSPTTPHGSPPQLERFSESLVQRSRHNECSVRPFKAFVCVCSDANRTTIRSNPKNQGFTIAIMTPPPAVAVAAAVAAAAPACPPPPR